MRVLLFLIVFGALAGCETKQAPPTIAVQIVPRDDGRPTTFKIIPKKEKPAE